MASAPSISDRILEAFESISFPSPLVYVYPTERSRMGFVMAFKVVPCNSVDSFTRKVFHAHWVVQGHLWFVEKSQDCFPKSFLSTASWPWTWLTQPCSPGCGGLSQKLHGRVWPLPARGSLTGPRKCFKTKPILAILAEFATDDSAQFPDRSSHTKNKQAW